jgi:hypothetical protein
MPDKDEREGLERELASSRELVHELEAELAALRPVAAELRQELRALRAGLGSTAELDVDEEDWPSGNGSERDVPERAGAAPPPPLPRPVIVPRLVLETAFLALAATIAVLADLEPLWIVVVMAAAWVIVAASEWAAFAKQRRWRLDEVAPPLVEGGSPAWYVPPVEQTVLEQPDRSESHTVVTSLPAEETDVQPAATPALEETGELTVDQPRRRFWQRRKHAEEPPGDPWEA